MESVDGSSLKASDDVQDIAQSALASAQHLSRTGRESTRRPRRRRTGTRGGGYSGPGPDDRDPQPVKDVTAGLFAERGWERPVSEARVFADWAALVGPELASKCQPVGLRDGVLHVAAESTAWATQLRMLAGTLLARLVAELGPDVVRRLSISGPVAPNWKHGAWSVRGRGPRDTYG